MLPAFERLGDVGETAVTYGKIADIFFVRGDLDEALRIRREEELPIFQRLGDARASAVTWGTIADILRVQGELVEALRIRREEELPVFEQLGEVRAIAVIKSKIADILFDQGDHVEALRIRREEELPVFERLGDVREAARTKGKIADILLDRGKVDEARSLQEARLATNHQLRYAAGIAATLWSLARLDPAQGKFQDAGPRIAEAYTIVRRLDEADGIAVIGRQFGQILAATGRPDDGLEVLRASAGAYLSVS